MREEEKSPLFGTVYAKIEGLGRTYVGSRGCIGVGRKVFEWVVFILLENRNLGIHDGVADEVRSTSDLLKTSKPRFEICVLVSCMTRSCVL